ncbi:MAG: hypothetical protein AAF611_08005 [Bacteroidota bacterium]
MKTYTYVLNFLIILSSINLFSQTPSISCANCVESVADLRTATFNIDDIITTKSYYVGEKEGASTYKKTGEGANPSEDNGGTVIIGDVNSNRSRYEMIHTDDVDIKQFGARVDGTTDDSVFLNNYAQYCVANEKKFTIHKGDKCAITQDLDLKGIDIINIEGEIRGPENTITQIIIGNGSNNGTRTNTFINSAKNCVVVITGTVHSTITINAAKKLELHANAQNEDYHSVAYNRFHLGDIQELHIHGTNLYDNSNPNEPATLLETGWVNENKFFGGNIKTLLVDGEYPCNNNIFYGTMFEDFTGIFKIGYSNYFYDVRFEGLLNLTFASNVFNTRFYQSYYQYESDFFKKRGFFDVKNNSDPLAGPDGINDWTINDLGQLNGVAHQADLLYKERTIFEINPTKTDGLDPATFIYDYDTNPLEIELTDLASYDYFYDSGIFKITDPIAIKFSSDKDFFDPHLYLYDENGQKINNNPNSYDENGVTVEDPIVNILDLGGSWFDDTDLLNGDPLDESRFRFNENVPHPEGHIYDKNPVVFPIFPKGRVFYARLRVRIGVVPPERLDRSFNNFSISIIESKNNHTVIGQKVP